MPHLHLPAQSGSDLVLKRMARRNSVSDFEALVAEARAHIPGVTITTDIIVGFPGETEAEFEESLAFARRVGFAHLHIFPYSARAGTAAARFAGQVPETERRRWSRLMNEVGEELGVIVRREFLRQTRPVLFESFQLLAPTDPSVGAGQSSRGTQDVIWSGLTDNYLRVLVHAPAGADLHNRILPTRLLGLAGANLLGQIESEDWSTGVSR